MKKNIFFIICCFVIGVTTSCDTKQKSNTTTTQVEQGIDKKVEPADVKYIKLAEETNKSMPMILPGGIRMDKAEAVSKTEYKYIYTFTQAPSVSAEEFIRSSKVGITMGLQKITGEKDVNMFKKDKMTILFAYYKMDGSLFAEIVVTPEEYIK